MQRSRKKKIFLSPGNYSSTPLRFLFLFFFAWQIKACLETSFYITPRSGRFPEIARNGFLWIYKPSGITKIPSSAEQRTRETVLSRPTHRKETMIRAVVHCRFPFRARSDAGPPNPHVVWTLPTCKGTAGVLATLSMTVGWQSF